MGLLKKLNTPPFIQHVNKTESAVQLRFNARRSPALSNAIYLRLVPIAGSRMTKDGIVVITANQFRERERNRAEALKRLVEMIRKAAQPVKRRRATKPTKASKERRLESKQRKAKPKKGAAVLALAIDESASILLATGFSVQLALGLPHSRSDNGAP